MEDVLQVVKQYARCINSLIKWKNESTGMFRNTQLMKPTRLSELEFPFIALGNDTFFIKQVSVTDSREIGGHMFHCVGGPLIARQCTVRR